MPKPSFFGVRWPGVGRVSASEIVVPCEQEHAAFPEKTLPHAIQGRRDWLAEAMQCTQYDNFSTRSGY